MSSLTIPDRKHDARLLLTGTPNHRMKILKSTVIQAATIQMEDWENGSSENRYAVLWKAKDEENRYLARSLQDAEEYYDYRCLIVEQKRI